MRDRRGSPYASELPRLCANTGLHAATKRAHEALRAVEDRRRRERIASFSAMRTRDGHAFQASGAAPPPRSWQRGDANDWDMAFAKHRERMIHSSGKIGRRSERVRPVPSPPIMIHMMG